MTERNEHLVNDAMADAGWVNKLVFWGGCAIALLPAIPLATHRWPRDWKHTALAIFVGVAVIALVYWGRAIRARRGRRWIAGLAFPLDVEAYWNVLGERSSTKTVEYEFDFADAVDDAAIVAWFAARDLAPTHVREWKVSGARFDTSTSYKGTTQYRNGAVHREFRDRFAPVFAELHALHPLKLVIARC